MLNILFKEFAIYDILRGDINLAANGMLMLKRRKVEELLVMSYLRKDVSGLNTIILVNHRIG